MIHIVAWIVKLGQQLQLGKLKHRPNYNQGLLDISLLDQMFDYWKETLIPLVLMHMVSMGVAIDQMVLLLWWQVFWERLLNGEILGVIQKPINHYFIELHEIKILPRNKFMSMTNKRNNFLKFLNQYTI